MVDKGNHPGDPRGLIFESYRIDGIRVEECRSIFLDWALGAEAGDMRAHLQDFLDIYGAQAPDHPMTSVLREGMEKAAAPKRRGGARGRNRPV